MGAINYFTSDYITIGVNTDIYYDEEIENDDNDFLYDEIKEILNRYNFCFFHVVLKSGYYEGFTVDIENNFSIAYNDYIDKKEALKEATQIKKFLLECIECGLCVCYPSWCTTYLNYEKSKKEIKEAIKEIKEEIKNTPTWLKYKKEG